MDKIFNKHTKNCNCNECRFRKLDLPDFSNIKEFENLEFFNKDNKEKEDDNGKGFSSI